MKKRLAGEGVAAKIRYADVAKRKPVKQVIYTLVLLVFSVEVHMVMPISV